MIYKQLVFSNVHKDKETFSSKRILLNKNIKKIRIVYLFSRSLIRPLFFRETNLEYVLWIWLLIFILCKSSLKKTDKMGINM